MDYNVLRKVIASCVQGSGRDPRFRLNMSKLRVKSKELGLIPLVYKSNYPSRMVTVDDIPFLMEYFKEDKLQWFDTHKSFLNVCFIREQDLDDELEDLLMKLHIAMKENEDKKYSYKPGASVVHAQTVKDSETEKEREARKRMGVEYHPPKVDLDIVNILSIIVGCYPCYTAVVAKWVKPDSISLYIRIRANSVLIDAENYDTITDEENSDETTDGTDSSEDEADSSSDSSDEGENTELESGDSDSDSGDSSGYEEEDESDDGSDDGDDVIEDENY